MRRAIDDLPGLLREWAQWLPQAQAAGYPEASTLWLALFGKGSGEFTSQAPPGIRHLEVYGALRRLVDAMASLLADEDYEVRRLVQIAQLHYLLGPGVVAERLGCSPGEESSQVMQGEELIRARMSA